MTYRILVVDDDPLTRNIIREHVMAHGHEVTEAGNGSEAIDILQQGNIDGLLLDILMPESDGIEVLMWMMKQPHAVPAVVFTQAGNVSHGRYLEIAERFGAIKSFAKPVSPENVNAALDLIHNALESGGS